MSLFRKPKWLVASPSSGHAMYGVVSTRTEYSPTQRHVNLMFGDRQEISMRNVDAEVFDRFPIGKRVRLTVEVMEERP